MELLQPPIRVYHGFKHSLLSSNMLQLEMMCCRCKEASLLMLLAEHDLISVVVCQSN